MWFRDLWAVCGGGQNQKRLLSGNSVRPRRPRFEPLEQRCLLSVGQPTTNPLLPLEPAAAEADYLIIAAHDLYDPTDPDDPVAELARWKQKKGFPSYVLQLPAWVEGEFEYTGDQMVEYIDEYITQAYNTGNQTSYVPLVGGCNMDYARGDYVEPAGNVLGSFETTAQGRGYLNESCGTDSAAPMISGVAALIWSQHPETYRSPRIAGVCRGFDCGPRPSTLWMAV